MPQLVFLHGPGAGACAETWTYQLQHFAGSVAPTLPGHPDGVQCDDVKGYMEWVRAWLHGQNMTRDLVLCGYTLGAAIGLQYALDYPDEVRGLVLSTISMTATTPAPGSLELRLQAAAGDQQAYDTWLANMEASIARVEPELRARLMASHRRIGPKSQHHDLALLRRFDVSARIGELRTPLLLIRGVTDVIHQRDGEAVIHAAVPGSRYVRLESAGHFPALENPAAYNRLVEEFVAGL